MAYSKQQRRRHIAEIQKYLYVISLFDNEIPQILADGNYGDETRSAVIAFQRKYGLPQNGSVDGETWNKIVCVYKEHISSEPVGYKAFPGKEYIISLGDCSAAVFVIQIMLERCAEKYANIPSVKISGKYDTETANAIMSFRKLAGLPQCDTVDSRTWNMLVKLCEQCDKA